MFGSFTAMPLHNFNFPSHVLVDMADKPNFRMFRDSFDVRHRAWISNTIHYLETNIKNKRRRYCVSPEKKCGGEAKDALLAREDSILGLLARDSSRDSLRETSRERLLARDFSGRAENATTNHRREWRR
jgi:hypothetical protein